MYDKLSLRFVKNNLFASIVKTIANKKTLKL